MSFLALREEDLVVGGHWKYIGSSNPYMQDGSPSYVLYPRAHEDISEGLYTLRYEAGGYDHRFGAHEIITRFIPFDNNLRPGVVAFAEQLTRAVKGGVPIGELQELLVRLEV